VGKRRGLVADPEGLTIHVILKRIILIYQSLKVKHFTIEFQKNFIYFISEDKRRV